MTLSEPRPLPSAQGEQISDHSYQRGVTCLLGYSKKAFFISTQLKCRACWDRSIEQYSNVLFGFVFAYSQPANLYVQVQIEAKTQKTKWMDGWVVPRHAISASDLSANYSTNMSWNKILAYHLYMKSAHSIDTIGDPIKLGGADSLI